MQGVRVVSEAQVRAGCPAWLGIKANERAFAALENGGAQVPERIVMKVGGGNTLFKPCNMVRQEGFGLKVVHIRADNAKLGIPTTPATITLFDRSTGHAKCLMSATYLTALRTAAGSAIATKCIAPADAEKLVVFGAGLQAETHIKTMCCVRDIRDITIINRTEKVGQQLIKQLEEDFKSFKRDAQGTPLSAIPCMKLILAQDRDQVQSSVEQADIICTTTGSPTALFPAGWVKAGAHINAVGSYQKDTTELEPALLARVNKLCVDTHGAWQSGDIGVPLEQGIVKREDATTLGKLIADPSAITTRDQGDVSLFKSTGVSVQDIVTAQCVFENCQEKDIGTVVEL